MKRGEGGFWTGRRAPSADELAELAEQAATLIPAPLRDHLNGIVFQIRDFPDDDMLAEFGIEDPFELLGLYQGLSLAGQDSGAVANGPDMVFLFRRPILDYWAGSEETLDHLIRHVLIHEIGHHFGLSDEDMERIEAMMD